MLKKKIALLGSTGSIGTSTLGVIRKLNNYTVYLLMANKNYKKIKEQIKIFKPSVVIIHEHTVYLKLKKKFQNKKIIILNNFKESKKYFKNLDICVSAISGINGLEPTIYFVSLCKKMLIANKESIICGWHLIQREAKKYNTNLIPIDSEHFSINFLLKKYSIKEIEKIYITASGGPFLNLNLNKLKNVKPYQAIKHPKWKMGKKISVDSATLMNKVLEVFEAEKLFNLSLDHFKILIHPQSLIHSIIELKNGLRIFLYHEPDMRVTILNALEENNIEINNTYKKNINNKLTFFNVDEKRFPMVKLINSFKTSYSSLIMLNGANELLVDLFLKKKIRFDEIYRFLMLFLNGFDFIKTSKIKPNSINKIKYLDKAGRQFVLDRIQKIND